MPPRTCMTTTPNMISRATVAKKAPISLEWTVNGAFATSLGNHPFMSKPRMLSAQGCYRRFLPPYSELFFQLVHEAPDGMLVDRLLGIGLYHPDVPHAQRVKTDRIFGVVIPPLVVGYVLEFLEGIRVVDFLDDLLCNKSSRCQLGVAGDDIVRHEDGADSPLGGYGVLLYEVTMPGHHTAEVLGPWFVNIGVY